jgi:CheY-like chemotaxis protein
VSNLENFLAPFSHLLFANRNLDIVILCFGLFVVTIIALTNRWQADRFERELTSNRSNPPAAPGGRRYAGVPMVEESPQEAGGLPPIKGGRTYARNLGSALQKAGMSGPQIYSPPTPTGFAPHANPVQPGGGQPGMGQPYAPPTGPWAAPNAPVAAPWAFPGGGARNAPGGMPPGGPYYQPQPPAPPQQPPSGFPPQPAPSVAAPGGYPPAQPGGGFPAQPSGPFMPPLFAAPTAGPAAPPPAFAPPGAGPMLTQPGVPAPVMPGLPMPAMSQPGTPAEPADGGRRGKPKRRRFNFNVLENLEKMVQSRPAEPAATGWTPAAPPAPAPPTAVNVAPPAAAPPSAPAPETTPQPAPGAAKAEPAPTLPFLFGEPSSPSPKPGGPPVDKPEPATEPVAEETAPEPVSATAAPQASASEPPTADEPVESEPLAAETTDVTPSEVEAPADVDTSQSSRRSMRSMMFGEEIAASTGPRADEPASPASDAWQATSNAEQPTEAPVDAEPIATTGSEDETTWPSYPWEQRSEPSSSVEPEEARGEEGENAEAVSTQEPTPPTETWTAAASWKSSDESEFSAGTEPQSHDESEPRVAEPEAAEVDAFGTGASGDGKKPGARTLVIIEDDQTAASYYETLFTSHGYEVKVANDGVSGVDLCTKVQPQVILLDVMMPRQNGILVLQTLRASEETKNTPVVVMSNFSEPTLIKRALQLGALEYVIKTQVEGPALLNAVPRWMNREKAFAAA